jgi:hypothetical protein
MAIFAPSVDVCEEDDAILPARGLEWRVPGALTSAADAQVSTRCAHM